MFHLSLQSVDPIIFSRIDILENLVEQLAMKPSPV